ncbi:hypothetical protein HPB47_006609 [Ixodes persulcatus]|uniref:Uncharacterized protein n=1 Tax=Ixodes persulcatus TaxID=34615 RepID=A0AC60P9V6_IXOPE|nr:hypothetical protein HPB47_006609 [Ixodes persulcatus]
MKVDGSSHASEASAPQENTIGDSTYSLGRAVVLGEDISEKDFYVKGAGWTTAEQIGLTRLRSRCRLDCRRTTSGSSPTQGRIEFANGESNSSPTSISKAAGIDDIELFRTDTFRYNEQQNTLIVNTPDETRAGKLNSTQGIEVTGRQYPVATYVVAPDGTVKGVMHGIPAEDTDDIITTSLVHPGNPSIVQARRMGQSNWVIILFQGRRIPFWVQHGCVET